MNLRPFLDTMTLKNADFSGSFSQGDFATTFMPRNRKKKKDT